MTGDLSNRDAQAFHFASEVIKQVITRAPPVRIVIQAVEATITRPEGRKPTTARSLRGRA